MPLASDPPAQIPACGFLAQGSSSSARFRRKSFKEFSKGFPFLGLDRFDLVEFIVLDPSIELTPVHTSFLAPSIYPSIEDSSTQIKISVHLSGVSSQTVVIPMSQEHSFDSLNDLIVPKTSRVSAPFVESINRFSKATSCGFPF